MQYLQYISFIFYGSRIFVLVCIFYLFLRNGNLKTKLHPWIIAANCLLLIAAIPYGITYLVEAITAIRSGDEYENYAFMNRVTGPYWWAYWLIIFNTVILPNLLWVRQIRHSAWVMPLYFISYFIEQYVIIIVSRYHSYLPTSWSVFHPFYIDWISVLLYAAMLVGMYYLIEWRNAKRVAV